jgi:hypothetical protein
VGSTYTLNPSIGFQTVIGVPAIGAVSVNPAAGSGASRIFSFQFSDSAGATDLAIVSALINGSTAISTACYVTYNRASGTLTFAYRYRPAAIRHNCAWQQQPAE